MNTKIDKTYIQDVNGAHQLKYLQEHKNGWEGQKLPKQEEQAGHNVQRILIYSRVHGVVDHGRDGLKQHESGHHFSQLFRRRQLRDDGTHCDEGGAAEQRCEGPFGKLGQ